MPGKLYRRDATTTDPVEREAAAVLESIGADLIFVLDPASEAYCAVDIHDPAANTADWASIMAALARARSNGGEPR